MNRKHSEGCVDQTPPLLEIRATAHKGRGVFASASIRSGTRIMNLEGARVKARDVPPESMSMQIEDDLWLCSDGSSVDDYVNHSCNPNVGFTGNDLALYALRDIHVGEELSWDYSTSISERGWSLVCRCGETNCRHLILSFDDLTFEEQERLAPISLPYLRNRAGARHGGSNNR